MRKERARELRLAATLAAQGASNSQALAMPTLYPEWEIGVPYGADYIVRRGGTLYRCAQAHTSQADWSPEVTASLWTRIDLQHAGTQDDPIPAAVNMVYTAGLYYVEGDKLYRCTRDSEVPLQYLPSVLVGQYFEEVSVNG